MSPVTKAQYQIHACVLLWGFTAVLGKLISLPALALVWWRMLIVVVCVAWLPSLWRGLRRLPPRLVAIYLGIGGIVALHWLAFYAAIKLANASVAVTMLAFGPVLLALVEPPIVGRRVEPRELLLGLAVLPGAALVAGGMPREMGLGALVGVLSTLLVAVFGALNKRYVDRADPLLVTALELGGGTLLLTLLAPLFGSGNTPFVLPDARDAALLVALALGCTLLPFALSLVALRHLSAYSVQLATNLEPVYAIVLAILLLGEQRQLGTSFYAGVLIIFSAVILYPLLIARPGRMPQRNPEADARSQKNNNRSRPCRSSARVEGLKETERR